MRAEEIGDRSVLRPPPSALPKTFGPRALYPPSRTEVIDIEKALSFEAGDSVAKPASRG